MKISKDELFVKLWANLLDSPIDSISQMSHCIRCLSSRFALALVILFSHTWRLLLCLYLLIVNELVEERKRKEKVPVSTKYHHHAFQVELLCAFSSTLLFLLKLFHSITDAASLFTLLSFTQLWSQVDSCSFICNQVPYPENLYLGLLKAREKAFTASHFIWKTNNAKVFKNHWSISSKSLWKRTERGKTEISCWNNLTVRA